MPNLVLDIVNNIIRQPRPPLIAKCGKERVNDLLLKVITLAKTMIDQNNSVTLKIAKQVATILDLEAVFEIIVEIPIIVSSFFLRSLFLLPSIHATVGFRPKPQEKCTTWGPSGL